MVARSWKNPQILALLLAKKETYNSRLIGSFELPILSEQRFSMTFPLRSKIYQPLRAIFDELLKKETMDSKLLQVKIKTCGFTKVVVY